MASIKHETAGCNLINTPELLESILLYLPKRELLRLQRVLQFKIVTEGSVLLQRKLFLAPEAPNGAPPRFNPLLFEDGEAFINRLAPRIFMGREGAQLKLRPGLKQRCPGMLSDFAMLDRDGKKASDDDHFHRANLSFSVTQRLWRDQVNWISPKAARGSWRKMLLVQPSVAVHWSGNSEPSKTRIEGILPAGATFRDLIAEEYSQNLWSEYEVN